MIAEKKCTLNNIHSMDSINIHEYSVIHAHAPFLLRFFCISCRNRSREILRMPNQHRPTKHNAQPLER